VHLQEALLGVAAEEPGAAPALARDSDPQFHLGLTLFTVTNIYRAPEQFLGFPIATNAPHLASPSASHLSQQAPGPASLLSHASGPLATSRASLPTVTRAAEPFHTFSRSAITIGNPYGMAARESAEWQHRPRMSSPRRGFAQVALGNGT
jgi:hypothetical protein